MVISIIGGSGSGKDTQAAFISGKYNIPHLSMGNILREAERARNPLALEAQKYYDQGKWVPDEITSKLLQDYIEAASLKGFVITGYPRFIEQTTSFDRILRELNMPLTAVLHIEVPDEVLLQRMHAQVAEAVKKGDERGDTTEEAIQQRLKSYKDTIDPILAEYLKRGILTNIDGTPSREEVRDAIFVELDKKHIKN
jgi:adenylate kinase